MPRPKHLTWEEAGCYTLVLATAYRMLFGHPPHTLKPGDNVLVWGGAGGLGSMAIQLIAASGANAIAVISEEDKRDFVMSLGAKGAINRKDFDCWGEMPDPMDTRRTTTSGWARRASSARRSGTSPARATTSTSCSSIRAPRPSRSRALVCKRGGMVVICAGTTGYKLTVDARYLWMRQKTPAGQPLRQPQAGLGRQPLRAQPAGRPVHERGVRLGRHPARAHEDVEEPAQAREHGGAGAGQAARACARSRRRWRADGDRSWPRPGRPGPICSTTPRPPSRRPTGSWPRPTTPCQRKVVRGGRVDAALLDQEQHGAHGLAWLKVYVAALHAMQDWALRLREHGRLRRARGADPPPGLRRVSGADRRRHPDEPGRDRAPARFRPRRRARSSSSWPSRCAR